MRVLVVGAGIGGLTLAQGLRQAGIEVRVYERDAPERRRQGISLHVTDQGMSALRACLPPRHWAMVEATTGRPRTRSQSLAERDGKLAVVRSEPLDDPASRTRPGRQVDRPLLRAVLTHGLADAIRFQAPCTRFETRADGTVRTWFGDGGTDTADVLVGADGLGSMIRGQRSPRVQVIDTGTRMLMGAAPARTVVDTGLLSLIGDDATSFQVTGGMMALGVLRFTEPPSAVRDRYLPDLRAAAVSDAEDYVMWALSVPQDRLGSPTSPHEVWSRACEQSRDLPVRLRTIIDDAWPEATVALRITRTSPAPPGPPGPVVLIGDAAHHSTPGFGGNLAMRDAHRLRDTLIEVASGRQDLLPALSGFEAEPRQPDLLAATPDERDRGPRKVVA